MEEEFNDIKAAVERARLVVNPWRTILKPSYFPQLFIAITSTLFQQVGLLCCTCLVSVRLYASGALRLRRAPSVGREGCWPHVTAWEDSCHA